MKILLFLVIIFRVTSYSLAEDLNSFLNQAEELRLHEDLQWKALLHYDEVFGFPHSKSRSTDPSFFLSPDGKYNPKAELEATLKAFLSSKENGDKHPICMFPARYEWLKDVLKLPEVHVECPRLNSWMEGLNTESVTVVFPASFINNPASAFGHTFIRLDQKNQTEDSRLLSYTADFSAQTFGEDAFTYAVKGIFGGYTGKYSVAPYYKKVTQYSDLENRDIWEYTLAFTEKEARLLALHFWELREIGFTYFYFDENCSYHILALLQVARPTLQLTKTLRTWVIPVDSIRVLQNLPGLIAKRVFRASAATKLRWRINAATPAARSTSKKIFAREMPFEILASSRLSEDEKAQSIDIAYDYETYNAIKDRDESAERKNFAWNLLRERSHYPSAKSPEEPSPIPSEDGHATGRLSFGTGRVSDRWVEEVSIRPAFHDLLDPQDGYLRGSQIDFFELDTRLTEGESLSIEKFKPLQIVSLSPRDDFFHPLSWNVLLELRRIRPTEYEDPFIFSLSSGVGHTYSLTHSSLVYGFLNGAVHASGVLDHTYALGGGPHLGILSFLGDTLALQGEVSLIRFGLGDLTTESHYILAARYSVSKDTVLGLELSSRDEFSRVVNAGMLKWQWFFTP